MATTVSARLTAAGSRCYCLTMQPYLLCNFLRNEVTWLNKLTDNTITHLEGNLPTWQKSDVFVVSVSETTKTHLGNPTPFTMISGLSKRPNVQLTITFTDGSTQSFIWRKGRAAEVLQAFQLRGWPVE